MIPWDHGKIIAIIAMQYMQGYIGEAMKNHMEWGQEKVWVIQKIWLEAGDQD